MPRMDRSFRRCHDCVELAAYHGPQTRHMRIMPAEKLAEFGTFSGKFHACLVCG